MKEIIIDVALGSNRVAVLEDGELVEFYIENPGTERLVGNIYRGKVSSVLPGMQAAFIDIGHDKNAFLYVDEAVSDEDEEVYHELKKTKIEQILKPGQSVTVQVIKDPIDTKGPRVTTQLTLPGRHLVLIPDAEYIGVSRRIGSDAERSRLRALAESVKPKKMGLIVRTASEGMTVEDFKSDVKFLLNHWKKIKKKEKYGFVPRCLHKDLSLIYRTVRDMFTPEVDRLVINNNEEYREIIDMVDMLSPKLKNRVTCYSKQEEIFQKYNIDSQLKKVLSRKVWLKCGGYIIIDKTEALTVIDVNTGKYVGSVNLEKTILKANIEAAEEIAKQLRLRDIGGIIVIDFIDMEVKSHQREVLSKLKNALSKDRTKSIVVGMTGLGLIELTRKKVTPGLNAFMTAECPFCDGTGKIQAPESIALKIEKKIGEYAARKSREALKIEAHPSVAALLSGSGGKNLKLLQRKYKRKIQIITNNDLYNNEVIINGEEVDMLS
ncbi:MAG: Rne/Rng family ribonuclease [Eubacteriales bacterium]|nr:Rne/Rng family ribonuclease [Eubacteriales bacterium]